MALRPILRRVHDAVARIAGATVAQLPFLETPFVAAGRRLADGSGAQVFYRRAASELSRRWRSHESSARPLTIGGRSIRLDVAEFYAHDHYFHGYAFEPGLTAFTASWLRPGDTFVDVGANHGYFSLLAATIVGSSGRVIAFEPHADARARMRVQLEWNGLDGRVDVQPLALSDRTGTATMHQAHHAALASIVPDQSPVRAAATFGDAFEVPTATFDEWRADHAIGSIRLMKVDVEGAELLVLRGMTQTLASGLQAIVLETTPESAADRLLRDAGYSVETLDTYPDGPQNRLYRPAR